MTAWRTCSWWNCTPPIWCANEPPKRPCHGCCGGPSTTGFFTKRRSLGVVRVYDSGTLILQRGVNTAPPGEAPVMELSTVWESYYEARTVGMQRYYTAMGTMPRRTRWSVCPVTTA